MERKIIGVNWNPWHLHEGFTDENGDKQVGTYNHFHINEEDPSSLIGGSARNNPHYHWIREEKPVEPTEPVVPFKVPWE